MFEKYVIAFLQVSLYRLYFMTSRVLLPRKVLFSFVSIGFPDPFAYLEQVSEKMPFSPFFGNKRTQRWNHYDYLFKNPGNNKSFLWGCWKRTGKGLFMQSFANRLNVLLTCRFITKCKYFILYVKVFARDGVFQMVACILGVMFKRSLMEKASASFLFEIFCLIFLFVLFSLCTKIVSVWYFFVFVD